MLSQSKSVFFLCVVLFVHCKTEQSIQPQIASNLSINSNYENDPKIDKIIKPYAKDLDAVMNEIIGFNPIFIEKQKPSSSTRVFFAKSSIIGESSLFTYERTLSLTSVPKDTRHRI